MHDWIIEADINRYQQAPADSTSRTARDRFGKLPGPRRARPFGPDGSGQRRQPRP
jgi:hypothetical protein